MESAVSAVHGRFPSGPVHLLLMLWKPSPESPLPQTLDYVYVPVLSLAVKPSHCPNPTCQFMLPSPLSPCKVWEPEGHVFVVHCQTAGHSLHTAACPQSSPPASPSQLSILAPAHSTPLAGAPCSNSDKAKPCGWGSCHCPEQTEPSCLYKGATKSGGSTSHADHSAQHILDVQILAQRQTNWADCKFLLSAEPSLSFHGLSRWQSLRLSRTGCAGPSQLSFLIPLLQTVYQQTSFKKRCQEENSSSSCFHSFQPEQNQKVTCFSANPAPSPRLN